MDHDRMLAVLTGLANGIDPASGMAFPTNGPYQHPETVRALFLALHRLEAMGSAGMSKGAAPAVLTEPVLTEPVLTEPVLTKTVPTETAPAEAAPAGRTPSVNSGAASKGGNAGKAWTAEEDQRLAAGFDAGEDINALKKIHGRSRLALEIRLAKLGRLPMPENTLYGNKPQPPQHSETLPPGVERQGNRGEQQGKARSAAPRSVDAPRRASESGGLRYHVGHHVGYHIGYHIGHHVGHHVATPSTATGLRA